MVVITRAKMLAIFAVVTLVVCAQASTVGVETGLDTPKNGFRRFNTEFRIGLDGYYSESYDVVTSDGYILEVNRIPNPRFNFGPIEQGSKPVVFLMHGLQSSGLAYIAAGPRLALAYILADAGYDVWLGNSRGIINSRRHLWLDPDHEVDRIPFFDYTFEDIGTKDLPAMIDFILRHTQQEQLHYVGHSQGGTVFLVLNSVMPEYNQKFKSVHLLAGVGYQNFFPSTILGIAAISTDLIFAHARNRGTVELFGPNPNNDLLVDIESTEEAVSCSTEIEACSPIVCKIKAVFYFMRGLTKALEAISGASIKQYAHYGQNIRDSKFRKWNYSPLKNLIKYGTLTPPEYDLSLVTANITMHYTVGDVLLHEQDVLDMAKVMPNTKVRRIARDTFSHFDFVLASDSRELVHDYIVKRLSKKYEIN